MDRDCNEYVRDNGEKSNNRIKSQEILIDDEMREIIEKTNLSPRKVRYCLKSRDLRVNRNVVKVVEDLKQRDNLTALDLGFGGGRDSIYLLKNGWKVIGVDADPCEIFVQQRVSKKQMQNFTFIQQKFENLELEKESYDLIVADCSLPFCNRENFMKVMEQVKSAINPGGYFVGVLFGENDSWNELRTEMTFLKKQELEKLFETFEEKIILEKEWEGKTTGSGTPKHWHAISIKAKK